MKTFREKSIIFYIFQGYLDCPADECECSQTDFETVYCCSCINMTRLPPGVVNCPNNCIAYCVTRQSFHCCLCDGDVIPRPAQPTTTTTTTTAAPSGGGGCFASTARVSLENGKSVAISELQVGDRVQTGMDVIFENFRIRYSNKLTRKIIQTFDLLIIIFKQRIVIS